MVDPIYKPLDFYTLNDKDQVRSDGHVMFPKDVIRNLNDYRRSFLSLKIRFKAREDEITLLKSLSDGDHSVEDYETIQKLKVDLATSELARMRIHSELFEVQDNIESISELANRTLSKINGAGVSVDAVEPVNAERSMSENFNAVVQQRDSFKDDVAACFKKSNEQGWKIINLESKIKMAAASLWTLCQCRLDADVDKSVGQEIERCDFCTIARALENKAD